MFRAHCFKIHFLNYKKLLPFEITPLLKAPEKADIKLNKIFKSPRHSPNKCNLKNREYRHTTLE